MNDELLAAEVDDLIRSMPEFGKFLHADPDVLEWRGRLGAVFDQLGHSLAIKLQAAIFDMEPPVGEYDKGARSIVALLYQARHSLRLKSPTATSAAVGAGAVFEYFDEIRKIITTAKQEILFIDPYMGAEFVSKFLTQIGPGVGLRLLTKNDIPALKPAVEAFAKQHGHKVEIRSSSKLHDRFVFLDHRECFQSGASFKDGAKNAPAVIVQIIDVFPAMHRAYEDIWTSATVERKP